MKIELSNINRIKRASIKLDGLTVIAGENDSGKSTLSKMIFSNIKAHANIIDYEKMGKTEKIWPAVRLLYKRLGLPLRRIGYHSLDEIKIPRTADDFIEKISLLDNVEIDSFISNFLDEIKKDEQIKIRTRSLIEQDLRSIEICLKHSDNPAALLQPEVLRLIESEFINNITSVNTSRSSFAFIDDDDNSVMSYELRSNSVFNLEYIDSFNFFKDATYVESPLHFQLQDILKRSQSYMDYGDQGGLMFFRSLMVPMHVKDFSDKIIPSVYDSTNLFVDNTLIQKIHNTTKGAFTYNREKRRIVFKNQLGEFTLNNVASGIKSFGVLEILLSNEVISPEKMLLWDEPENHLHPQWQVYFADVLVQLAKAGIPIVVCSHSPYFIQAIRHFSSVHSIEDSVDYYMSRIEDDGLCTFDEVTTDLNRIFSKLAAPMNEIMNFG